MEHNTLFGRLLSVTYEASGAADPIELFFSTMFSGYYSLTDTQPSCATVRAILLGKARAPKKLLRHYLDLDCPRCPRKLEEDLSALAECCFVDAARRNALRNCLETYLQSLPQADREDLLQFFPSDDLIRFWTGLAWYALCGDNHG